MHVVVSAITYTYHNIIIFAVFKEEPNKLKYRPFKRPEFLRNRENDVFEEYVRDIIN